LRAANKRKQQNGQTRIQDSMTEGGERNYKALVRNSEGSEELTVILYGYGKIMYFHAHSDY
jgi:hypothetical protein